MLSLITFVDHSDLLDKLKKFGAKGLSEEDRANIERYSTMIKMYDTENVWSEKIAVQAYRELTKDAGAGK